MAQEEEDDASAVANRNMVLIFSRDLMELDAWRGPNSGGLIK